MSLQLRYLKKDEYESWDSLVEASPHGNVFCYSWWLQAVESKIKVLGCFDNDHLIAGIPLYSSKSLGINRIIMPKLTQTWGVIITPLPGKHVNAFSREMEILKLFASELQKYKYFAQSFSPNLQNWLPFYWKGFQQTTRFTYVFENLNSMDELWKGLRENIRTDIRKSVRKGISIRQTTFSTVFPLFEKTFTRQNLTIRYTREYLEKLYDIAVSKNAGECFAAIDLDGKIHAAAFLVWDKKRAFYLVGGGDPALRNSGATSHMVWEMIRFASERSAVFDFEGSMIESIEKYFRAFGATQRTFNIIYKKSPIISAIEIVKNKTFTYKIMERLYYNVKNN